MNPKLLEISAHGCAQTTIPTPAPAWTWISTAACSISMEEADKKVMGRAVEDREGVDRERVDGRAHRIPESAADDLSGKNIPSRRNQPSRWAANKRNAFAVVAQSPLIALGLQGWHWLRTRRARHVPASVRTSMRLVAHLALGGRKTLALVEIDGQRYLVGGGADSVTAIVAASSAPAGPAVAANVAAGESV
ncbi:MAG TPA: flagellar biosynthetic protein FliO [Acidobacteriaceae bacterium]|nr:flagellar biosynthetic protein FliO [Acidobacteriaceae bacterium]